MSHLSFGPSGASHRRPPGIVAGHRIARPVTPTSPASTRPGLPVRRWCARPRAGVCPAWAPSQGVARSQPRAGAAPANPTVPPAHDRLEVLEIGASTPCRGRYQGSRVGHGAGGAGIKDLGSSSARPVGDDLAAGSGEVQLTGRGGVLWSGVAVDQDEEDDDPGGGDGEAEWCDETAHRTNLPVVTAAWGQAHTSRRGRHPGPRCRGAHDGTGRCSGRRDRWGRGGRRQRSDTLTSGPATTRRIAISHSDHLHRSVGHRNRR